MQLFSFFNKQKSSVSSGVNLLQLNSFELLAVSGGDGGPRSPNSGDFPPIDREDSPALPPPPAEEC